MPSHFKLNQLQPDLIIHSMYILKPVLFYYLRSQKWVIFMVAGQVEVHCVTHLSDTQQLCVCFSPSGLNKC